MREPLLNHEYIFLREDSGARKLTLTVLVEGHCAPGHQIMNAKRKMSRITAPASSSVRMRKESLEVILCTVHQLYT